MSNQTILTTFAFGGTSGTIPGGAINIQMVIGGGRGGTGGSDAGGPGGAFGLGREGLFSIPTSSSARSWSGYPGYRGQNGPGGSGAVNGGPGGQNGPINGDGGLGGADGTSGWSGCGGGGGAAGGFYLSGTLVAVAGGGGGGGGGSYSCGGAQRPGGTGGAGGGFAGVTGNIGLSNGGNGGNKGGGDGGGGGAGGGGAGGGNGGGAGQDCQFGGGGGGGGGSQYRSDVINFISQGQTSGDGGGYVSYQLRIAEINSFTVDDTPIISGQATTLRWSVTDSNSQSITPSVGGVGSSGSTVIAPTQTTDYLLTAIGDGGNDTQQVTVTVYDPVVCSITAAPPSMTVGNGTTLQWLVTGSTSGAATIDQGIGAVLNSSFTVVYPTTTTTYTLSASGPGGSDTDSVTVFVWQYPQITCQFPNDIDYNQSITLPVTYRYASQGVSIIETYTMRDPTGVNEFIQVTNNSSLPAAGPDDSGQEVTNDFTPAIPWGIHGPFNVQFSMTANGNGGNTPLGSVVIPVNIDRIPNNINIPKSDEENPGEPIVIAPPEEIVVSDPIVIEGVDIPVEIKANKPIQVKFDDADPNIESSWYSVRESD